MQPGAMSTLRAKGNAAAAGSGATIKPAPTPKKKTTARKPAPGPAPAPSPGQVVVQVSELQSILQALGWPAKGLDDGEMGPTTRSKYTQSTRKRKLSTVIVGTPGGTQVKVNEAAYNALKSIAGVAPAPPKPPPGPVAPATKDITVGTHEVQGILKRLGYPPDRLSDGMFGKTTGNAWAQSATKRRLDPFISAKGRDIKQVVVRERAYLELKADADAKVPPAPSPDVPVPPVGGDLISLPPDVVSTVTVAQLGDVLGRLTGATQDKAVRLDALYKDLTGKLDLDPRIQATTAGSVLVIKTTWNTLMSMYDQAAPTPPKPEEEFHIEKAKEGLLGVATAPISAKKIRLAFNAAIQKGALKREPFSGSVFVPGMIDPILKMFFAGKPAGDPKVWTAAWHQLLVAAPSGTLVSEDGKTVKLTPAVTKDLNSLAAQYVAQKKAGEEVLSGFTVVDDTAKLIGQINSLGITTKKFDKSGGAKELSDAITTFFEETKTSKPAGVMVRTVKDKVYVKDTVLTKLANEAMAVTNRAAATKAFRDKMVANALSESPATITVRELQEAVKDTVLRDAVPVGQPGAPTTRKPARVITIFKPVKVTGRFDDATRTAYAEVARTLLIGTAVQELQKLMVTQWGPAFKTNMITEASNQVWNDYITKALYTQNGELSLKTTSAIAANVRKGSTAYRANVSEEDRRAEEVGEQNRILEAAVKKSKALVSILDLQQALTRMTKERFGDALLKPTGVSLTGVAGAPTSQGLLQLASYIFPEDYVLPETMWMAYLNKVGIKMVAAEAGAVAKEGWRGATYVALPPALADLVSKSAGKWIEENGDSTLRSDLAPLPAANESLRLRFGNEYVVVTTKTPEPETPDPVFKGDATDEPEPTQPSPAPAPAPVTVPAPAPPAPAPVTPAPVPAPAPVVAPPMPMQPPAPTVTTGTTTAAGGAQVGPTQAGGAEVTGPSITGPQITGPTIQITTPTPAPVQKAGMGVGGIIGIAAAAALGIGLLLKGGDQGE
jgi:hypothetical protein